MSSKEIEETEEFKNIDEKIIVDKSDLYVEYDGNKHWKFDLPIGAKAKKQLFGFNVKRRG